MENIESLSIGIGLVISLVFSEMLGLTAGGLVVPGYMALYLDRPLIVILTCCISYLTYFIVHALSAVMIIYGRRRTVLMILLGFAMGALLEVIRNSAISSGDSRPNHHRVHHTGSHRYLD